MSNWQYANDVPTSRWRGAMTTPRELTLTRTAEGLRLGQDPVLEQAKVLRDPRDTPRQGDPSRQFLGGTIAEANAWLRHERFESGPLEMVVSSTGAAKGKMGVRLFKGKNEETVVTLDHGGRRVSIDRTHAGEVAFHPKFRGIFSAPIPPPYRKPRPTDPSIRFGSGQPRPKFGRRSWAPGVQPVGEVLLVILVDKCSVEVFVNGVPTLTALVFPSEHARGLELFGPEEDRRVRLSAWRLVSAKTRLKP
jgi:sucrose-6-phosphate hydrolase SacC (GH32 family)